MVLTKAPRRFSPAEEELLELFAAKAAMALENARLYQEAQRAYHELARTQERLTQSQKMEVIGRLAGGIAHDFNNLLTVISGRAQLLQFRLGRDHPLCRHAELIEAMATQTSTLTRQLLAFSRKQVLQPKVLDLNTLVTSMGTMLGRMINENIDLVIVRGADLGCVEADPGQMEQVIMNLAINARDAMPEGGRLTIETANGEPSESHPAETASVRHRRHVRLTVSDTGCGMDAETRAHLFEPFFTTKEPGKGTGLGLATVHGIVEQSGGAIEVESEPGRGTAVTIYLPRVDTPAEAMGADQGQTPAGRLVGSETILLAEDEEAVRDLAREILEEHGYTVLEAGDGVDALRTCEAHAGPIDLLVTDVIMPRMSGRELAERVTARRPDIKVLYMSGHTDDAVLVSRVLTSGAAFLQKPFTPDALAAKLREVLDGPAAPPAR